MAELLDTLLTPSSLEMHYHFEASPDVLFRAWTEPDLLRQWFRVSPDYTTPIAEVDLRVGGQYRLGMRTPEGENIIAGGEYRELRSPEKLAFTWKWESAPFDSPHTLVTLRFIKQGLGSEIILLHQHLQSEEDRDSHLDGWTGCFAQLFAIQK